jgi:hypothetical protein
MPSITVHSTATFGNHKHVHFWPSWDTTSYPSTFQKRSKCAHWDDESWPPTNLRIILLTFTRRRYDKIVVTESADGRTEEPA